MTNAMSWKLTQRTKQRRPRSLKEEGDEHEL